MNTFETDLRNGKESRRAGSDPQELRVALISPDDHVRDVVSDAIRSGGLPITIGLEIVSQSRPLEPEHLERLRSYDPHAIILDMVDDPERSVRAAAAITSGIPHTALVGLGPELDASRLLDAMRAGIVEYVPGLVEPGTLRDALERVMRKGGWGASLEGNRNGQLLAFFSPKGGSGSTTVVTNVGIELHRITGKRTLLVDLDLELGEIASLLGVRPRFHLVDLVRNFHRMDADLLPSYIERHESGVHVLSAPFKPEIGEEVGAEQIGRILGFLRSHYDYVLVDTSKSLAPPALAALQTADPIFLITNMDVPSLRNLKRCLPILDEVTAGDAKRLRLVVNRFNPKSLVSLDDIEDALGIEVYWTLMNDFSTVINSISAGQPLTLHGNSRYADELRELARDIAKGALGVPPTRASLFDYLLSFFPSRSPRRVPTPGSAPVEVSAHV